MKVETKKEDRYKKITALEEAWNSFAEFDHNACLTQQRFYFMRKLILIIGVLATGSAVIHSLIPDNSMIYNIDIKNGLHYIVIILPILVSILLSGAVKFERGTIWVLLRNSAETLKQEIYRYRAKVDIYNADNSEQETRDIKLAHKVKIISSRLMKTQLNQASLKLAKGYKFENSAAKEDDRFSDLTPNTYIEWRLKDQYNYYRKKTVELDKKHQILQWIIYSAGGFGTFLAAVNQEIWVAVTISFAGAITAFLEIKRIEPTLTAYNQAATDLNGIFGWWTALSATEKEKHTNFEKLVKNTELVIKTENAGWVQEMQDALVELYSDENPKKDYKIISEK